MCSVGCLSHITFIAILQYIINYYYYQLYARSEVKIINSCVCGGGTAAALDIPLTRASLTAERVSITAFHDMFLLVFYSGCRATEY